MSKEKLLLVAAGLLVVALGVAYLVDGRLLKTQVAPGGGGATAKDWESIGAPDLGAEMVGPTSFCPSPLQYWLPSRPSPTVSATPISCKEGYVAEGYNEYKLVIDEREIRRNEVNGLDAGYILTAVCEGNPSPPGCGSGSGAFGCAWVDFEDFLPVNIDLTGLYKKVGGLFKLVDSAYVYPDGLNHPETRQRVPGVYPSPPNPEELSAWLTMSLWKLAAGDEQELRERHPKLLEVAQRQISGTEEHEKVHWGIYERYLPNYLSMINRPWSNTDWSVATLEALQRLIEDEFKSGWQAVATLEAVEHEAFHEQEVERREKEADIVPYDGLDNIICGRMEGMVGMFGLIVNGQGYAAADYPTGGRAISCDTYCSTEYFTSTAIKIEARPKSGYRFKHWVAAQFDRSCTGCAGSTSPACTLQIGSKGDTCGAVFEPIGSPAPTGVIKTPSQTFSPSSQSED